MSSEFNPEESILHPELEEREEGYEDLPQYDSPIGVFDWEDLLCIRRALWVRWHQLSVLKYKLNDEYEIKMSDEVGREVDRTFELARRLDDHFREVGQGEAV